jgi:hypothetical protein
VNSNDGASRQTVSSRAVPPYSNGHEHIADLLARHDWLLRREIARGHARRPNDILGFAAITEQEVERLLDDANGEPARPAADLDAIDNALQSLEQRIAVRMEESLAQGVRLPIIELANRFGLSELEIDILLACLAVELDRRYERIYGYLHDDMSRRQPSPGLVLSLYCHDKPAQLAARAALSPLAALRYYRLVDVLEDSATTPWLSRPMRVDERIVAFLLGDDAADSQIARLLVRSDSIADSSDVRAHQRETLDALLAHALHWTTVARVRKKPLIYLHGEHDADGELLVRSAARQLGVALLAFDAELLADVPSALEQAIFLMFREGVLMQSALFLRNAGRLFEQPGGTAAYRALLRCLSEMGSIAFICGDRPWSMPVPADPIALHVAELRPPGASERFDTWQALTRGDLPASDLHQLVSLHPLPLGAIEAAWRVAQGFAAAEGATGLPSLEHLHRACRMQAGTPTNSLAQRIEPKHQWDDLVLPAEQREQLAALCSQAKHGSIVYGQWRFERKLSLGRGLNALFSGPPGTGKTMAAEVIAADLGVPLLKIDLSQVVSKYIGETEKNLRQLFEQATRANAILFFDEADALLGKRSEVKDAHDRYANQETAYLLQKMEEYTGISVLSTNLRQNMDQAFTRRMRFIVDFPFPEEEDRLRIWRTVWPCEVPLAADVDLAALARQFRLTGGSIRNIALAATFLAAEQGQAVSMRHLMRAARRELQKMGRLLSNEARRA